MKLDFNKYQGTGNDFILIDNRDGGFTPDNGQVAFLCDRKFGVGADGLILLETEPDYDFRMEYYNSDGNKGSMCGNGGRCIVAFAKRLGIVTHTARFIAFDGEHEARIDDDGKVSLKMNDVRQIETGNGYHFLDTGSPHYVAEVKDLAAFDVVTEGKKIRYNNRFCEEGTNVDFIEKLEDALFVRTYERGVENETLSCGTGVTAAAISAAVLGLANGKNHCSVMTPGGMLEVTYEKVLEHNFYNIWLKGPAEFVYSGSVEI